MKALIVVLAICCLCGCVKEKDMTPACRKWTVEINNPEATVVVENGRLVVDIPHPKTFKDVRLVQQQKGGENYAEVGAWLKGTIQAASQNDKPAVAEMRLSFGYQHANGAAFIGKSVSSGGAYKGYVNDKVKWHSSIGQFTFFATGTSAFFEPNHQFQPVETPLVSAAEKNLYLDFGVDPGIAHRNPIASLHAEVDLVQFGDYTSRSVIFTQGQNQKYLGFEIDLFECNSLKNE